MTKKMNGFQFGQVSVPDGKKGKWRVETFTIAPEEDNIGLFISNFRAIRDGHAFTVVRPGTFKRLVYDKKTTVMSNTQMEVLTARECYENASGSVLVNGLGLGMVLEGLLHKPDVTRIRVVEIDKDVIALVGKHFKDKRLEIVQGDAFAYTPSKGEVYDYIWHDIWNDLDDRNFPEMAELTRKWRGRARLGQGVWSRKELRKLMRSSNGW